MATNPMQKKARNAMLGGVIIGLIIGGLLCAILYIQLMRVQKEIKETKAATKTVYVLKNDVKSGQKIDLTVLEKREATQNVIPTDFITDADITENTIAKVDLTKGCVLSKALIHESDAQITSDLRQQEYNMLVLPQQLEIGDYIDVRLRLGNGQDYIVVSKKEVTNATEDTIWMNLYEQETLAMSNAIVEAYKMTGAKLYVTTYVEPGNQQNATPTYVPSAEVINLINGNKNITDIARKALAERYTAELRARREQDINSQLSTYAEEAQENLETNVEQEITSSKDARKQYIDSLNASIEE